MLKKYPGEKLICAKDRQHFKWYISDGKKRELLKKSERKQAETLAMKKYLTLQLEDALHKKKALDSYLKYYDPEREKAIHLLDDNSGYKELLVPFIKTNQEVISEWEKESFQSNPKHPEHKIHTTISGYKVRSKAESMIEKALVEHRIPHRYECRLVLGKNTLYPDFTLLHPDTKQKYIWEHFGDMDNQKYADDTFWKLKQYNMFGIVPGIDLIMTYETKNHPLTIDVIENVINQYFS